MRGRHLAHASVLEAHEATPTLIVLFAVRLLNTRAIKATQDERHRSPCPPPNLPSRVAARTMLSLATSKHHAGPSSSAPPGQRHRLATGRARRRPVLAAAAADAPSSSASEPSSSSSSSSSGVSIDASSAAVAPPAGNSTAPRRAAAAPVRMSLRSFVDMDDGGPPRVTSLLDPGAASLADGAAPVDRQHLPLMLYLPGIDGSGLAAARQFPSLLRSFDLRTLVTPPLVGVCCARPIVRHGVGGRAAERAGCCRLCVRAAGPCSPPLATLTPPLPRAPPSLSPARRRRPLRRTARRLRAWCKSQQTFCVRRCPPCRPPAQSTFWGSRLEVCWPWRWPPVGTRCWGVCCCCVKGGGARQRALHRCAAVVSPPRGGAAARYHRWDAPAVVPCTSLHDIPSHGSSARCALLCAPPEVPALVDRLVLVNPATSFKDSLWPVLGPLLPQVRGGAAGRGVCCGANGVPAAVLPGAWAAPAQGAAAAQLPPSAGDCACPPNPLRQSMFYLVRPPLPGRCCAPALRLPVPTLPPPPSSSTAGARRAVPRAAAGAGPRAGQPNQPAGCWAGGQVGGRVGG